MTDGDRGARPHWIVVVHRDRPEVLARLRAMFAGSAWIEVLDDRRRGERRQPQATRTAAFLAERRLGERRHVPGDRTRAPSYRLASRGDGFQIYEATGFAPARCPQCGATVLFEMPRFADPPARLDLRVIHEAVSAHHPTNARHIVELDSFGPGGRLLLSSRTLARIRAEPS
jgi:hypothetical protein